MPLENDVSSGQLLEYEEKGMRHVPPHWRLRSEKECVEHAQPRALEKEQEGPGTDHISTINTAEDALTPMRIEV